MTDYTPLQSYGHESRKRITMPVLPWASATQPEPIRRAMMETKADKMVLRAKSDNARRPLKPNSNPNELWFAIRSQEAAKRDGHFGALPKTVAKANCTPGRRGSADGKRQDQALAFLAAHGPSRAADVAAALGIGVSYASAVLARMVARGLARKVDRVAQTIIYEATNAD